MTANVAPALCSQFQEACLAGDFATALSIQDRLAPLHEAMFIEPNPAGPKYALSLLGFMEEELRVPLVKVTEETQQTIRKAMVHAGLIN